MARPLCPVSRAASTLAGDCATCVAEFAWTTDVLFAALDRAERALAADRARACRSAEPAPARDEELRAKVREVVEELDELIRQAAA